MSDYDEARELIRQGITAFKARNKTQAAALFQQAIQLEPDNQSALLWLAGCTNNPAERQQYLIRVVHINPNNEPGIKAASALAEMKAQQQHAPTPAPAPTPTQPQADGLAGRLSTAQATPAAAAATAGQPGKAPSQPLNRRLDQQNADAASAATAAAAPAHAIPDQGVQPFVPPAKGQQSTTVRPFVLGPQNRAFAEGRAKYPMGSHNYRLGLLLLSLFLIAGIGLLIGAASTWLVNTTLKNQGVDTQAEVVSRRIREGESENSYFVTYRFQATGEDGLRHWYTDEDEVTYRYYHQYTPESRATVRYLPEIPDVSRIEGRSTWGEQILTLMALLWNAFIIPTFVFVIFMYLNDRSRMRTGQVLVGELLNARGYDDGDGGYMVMVEYQFQAPRVGRLHKESDEVLRNDLHKKPLPERGTPVLVWYKDWSNFDIL